MYAEFECGRCESRMQIDAEDHNEAVWSLVWRFANAHTSDTCGMLTPGTREPAPAQKVIPRTLPRSGGEASV